MVLKIKFTDYLFIWVAVFAVFFDIPMSIMAFSLLGNAPAVELAAVVLMLIAVPLILDSGFSGLIVAMDRFQMKAFKDANKERDMARVCICE